MGLFSSFLAPAQLSPQRLAAMRSRLGEVNKVTGKLSPVQRGKLSGGAVNLLQMAENWNKIEPSLEHASITFDQKLATSSRSSSTSSILVPVSNPATDFLFSIMTGFTQSETSTAWCGSNVVVGFNDSGSIPESVLFGPGGVSLSGVAFSTNQGAAFRDAGFVNPGSNPANFLAGDPVLSCVDASTFYYAQIFETADAVGNPLTAVSLSTSTDGGANWGDPVVAVEKDGLTHFIDKDWMTVDPTNPKTIFVTYTDFDSSGACVRLLMAKKGLQLNLSARRMAERPGVAQW